MDIEVLPDAIPRGKFSPVEVTNGKPTFVTIDLETTDLSKYMSTDLNFIASGIHKQNVLSYTTLKRWKG